MQTGCHKVEDKMDNNCKVDNKKGKVIHNRKWKICELNKKLKTIQMTFEHM